MRKKLGLIIVSGWALTLSVVAGFWMSAHLIAFNPQSIPVSKLTSSKDRLTLHHFLSLSCDCSKGVLRYLQQRGLQKGQHEVVHLITENKTDWESRLKSRGFDVEILDEEQAVDFYKVQSVPQLVIVQAGRVLYQGGYNADQSHRTDYRDLEIAADLDLGLTSKAKQALANYPLFGCANGRMRKSKVDPWKLKYAN